MTNERFFTLMNEIDDRLLLREAVAAKKSTKKAHWLRWGALAACLALVLGIGLAWNSDHTVTLESGDTLRFARGGAFGQAMVDIDGIFNCEVQSRYLTQTEAAALADGFKFEGWGFFNGESGTLLGFEGWNEEGIYLQVSSGPMWSCTALDGVEQTCVVNGVPVSAGYTDANHSGKRIIIYYATLEFGCQTVYLEHGGLAADREELRLELADMIETLIAHGEIDLTQIHY